jgi:hypothetical protein
VAGSALIVIHAFQWSIIDRITPFLYITLASAVWWGIIGVAIASLTCLTKIKAIGWRAFVPMTVVVASVLIVMFVPFTSLWLDFDYWRYKEVRLEIVERILSGDLAANVDYNPKLIALDGGYPLVSMGGNEVIVERHEGSAYVLFFTFRGVLDNYSGFLYVPDGGSPTLFSDLHEEQFTQIEPLEENWFFVSHR